MELQPSIHLRELDSIQLLRIAHIGSVWQAHKQLFILFDRRAKLLADTDQLCGLASLNKQLLHRLTIEIENEACFPLESLPCNCSSHVGITVAITTEP